MLNIKNVILEGVVYTIMGILVVFLMLLIIMYVIKAMQLFSRENKSEPKPQKAEVVKTIEAPKEEKKDDSELIAVITAAVAAVMGKSSSGLIVRSYKKLSGDEWNKMGRREILENRF